MFTFLPITIYFPHLIINIYHFKFLNIYFICKCVQAHVCHSARADVKGRFVGVASPLPQCESQGQNSGCQPWWQAPLPLSRPVSPEYIILAWRFSFSDLGSGCDCCLFVCRGPVMGDKPFMSQIHPNPCFLSMQEGKKNDNTCPDVIIRLPVPCLSLQPICLSPDR